MDEAASSHFFSLVRRAALAIGIAIALYLLLFVHAPSERIPGRTNIRMWHVTGADEVEDRIPNLYNANQEKVYLHAIGLPFASFEQKLLTSVIGGIPPDVLEYFGSVVQWSSRGALLPLDDLMERSGFDRDSVFPALWPELEWNGRTFAVPNGVSCNVFFWNKDHFREAGLDPERGPRTWEELEAYALALTKRNERGEIVRAGYIPGYWSETPIWQILDQPFQKGARFLSEDGTRVTLATDAAAEAYEFDAHLFDVLGRDELIRMRASFGYGTQNGFLSGRLSMINQKSGFVQDIRKFAPHINYGCSLLPYPEDGQPATVGGAAWIGIPAGTRHPEAAWDYVMFQMRPDVQIRVAAERVEADETTFFPAVIEAAKSPAQMSVPYMQVLLDSMDYAHSSTVVPLAHHVFWREMMLAWESTTRGETNAREALQKGERVVQKALDDRLEYQRFYEAHLRRQ